MAVYKTISSKRIIRKIFRDLKPSSDNWIDDAVEWIGEALEHIGASSQLCQKQCVLEIVDHKVLMPSDLYFINQVAINGGVTPATSGELDKLIAKVNDLKAQIATAQAAGQEYSSTTTVLHEINSRIKILENVYFNDNSNTLQPLQYGASTFHRSMHCEGCVNENAVYEETYIIDCDYIKTSFHTGKICISYMALPTDENNQIDYTFADQQWKYYCTQARNAANFPDIDRYESFMNQWVRLIPEMNSHDLAFENLNTRENLNRN